jgi:hypothetical protein
MDLPSMNNDNYHNLNAAESIQTEELSKIN